MLYRTHHHPFLFPLNPFTPPASLSSHPSSHPHPLPTTLSPSLPQVAQAGMEGAEAAAASAVKTGDPSSVFSDDLLGTIASNGQSAVPENDFFVDDLLDFSYASLIEDPEEHKQDNASDKDCCATTEAASKSNVIVLSTKDEFESLPVSGLSVPADDVESLEWLSHFVEDSFSQYSLTCPLSKLPPEASKARSEPEIVMVDVKQPPTIPTPVQTKARTKRARTGGRVWSLGSPSLSESPSSSTSSSSTTTSSSSPLPWLLYSSSGNCQTQTAESLLGRPRAKKPTKKPAATDAPSGGTQQPRRCSHCGVQKTPQWRAGPLGAKTLCNACGVRFKSGRLLPEYRPACSPTFSNELHSNNHRKVLEMRRKKEVDGGLAPPVQSF